MSLERNRREELTAPGFVDMVDVDRIARKIRRLEPPEAACRLADELTVIDLARDVRAILLAKWTTERWRNV